MRLQTGTHDVMPLRKHGTHPYVAAVVHGGPGAAGELSPVARRLGRFAGVLEPWQTADTIPGQVEELARHLQHEATGPAVVIGHSWGAWLGIATAARHPHLVKRLILVGTPGFEDKYAERTTRVRWKRLSREDRQEYSRLLDAFAHPLVRDKDDVLARLGALAASVDSVDPLRSPKPAIAYRADIFARVWSEADQWRRQGRWLSLARTLRCPVLAVHGDRDPHPAAGVRLPLAGTVRDFRFVLLRRCGHSPWLERSARDAFFDVLRQELRASVSPKAISSRTGLQLGSKRATR